MFDKANEHIKREQEKAIANGKRPVEAKSPKIRFDKFILYQPKSGNYVGSTYVGKPDRDGWYARIEVDGTLTINSREHLPGLEDTLRELAKDPAAFAAEYGKRTNNCCFCGKDITRPESLSVGYGPDCAEKYGLPWG